MKIIIIAIVLLAASCILNTIILGDLRRDNARIWNDLVDITDALKFLLEEQKENYEKFNISFDSIRTLVEIESKRLKEAAGEGTKKDPEQDN